MDLVFTEGLVNVYVNLGVIHVENTHIYFTNSQTR